MGILDRALASSTVHVVENFFTEEELILLDSWVESSIPSAEYEITTLSAKTSKIVTNRQSVRPVFVRVREFIKNAYNTDTLTINQIKALHISPWAHEVIADPDYVPTEEQLATWDRPKKVITFDDERYWSEGKDHFDLGEDKFHYTTPVANSGEVIVQLFKDDNGIDLALENQCHATIVLRSPFTGGSIKVGDSDFNVSPGSLMFFKKQVSEQQRISEILTGDFKSLQLLISEDKVARP
jgi:hypothetical protein